MQIVQNLSLATGVKVVIPSMLGGGLTAFAVSEIADRVLTRCSSLEERSRYIHALVITACIAAIGNIGVIYGVALTAIQELAAISFFGGVWLSLVTAMGELHRPPGQQLN